MHMLQTNANLDEEAPDSVLTEILVLAFVSWMPSLPQELVQVTMLAVLHNDIDFVVLLDKRIVVLHDERWVHPGHHVDLFKSFIVMPKRTAVNFLDNEDPFLSCSFSNFVNLSVAAFSKDSEHIVIMPRRYAIPAVQQTDTRVGRSLLVLKKAVRALIERHRSPRKRLCLGEIRDCRISSFLHSFLSCLILTSSRWLLDAILQSASSRQPGTSSLLRPPSQPNPGFRTFHFFDGHRIIKFQLRFAHRLHFYSE